MKSLLEAEENASFVQRVENLRADSGPEWGKMNVAQMLAHCQKPFLVAAGELKLKRALIGRLLGGWAKKKFVDGDAPFGHNGPTDPHFLVPGASDFEREKAQLIDLVRKFGEHGAQTRDPHPFFGPMTGEDWDRLMWKHLDHHLRQFGV